MQYWWRGSGSLEYSAIQQKWAVVLKRKFEGKLRDSNESVSLLTVDADWVSNYFNGFPDDMGIVI